MNIEFSYPVWFAMLCVLLGVLYSVGFYRKERHFEETPQWVNYVMALLRFFCVTVLSLLLLEPLIQDEVQEIEKPIVVIAQDNSESVTLNKDSTFYFNEYPELIGDLEQKLSTDYEVVRMSFGEGLSDSIDFLFNEKETDFSDLFDNLSSRYYGRNLGAVILASDGVYNKGVNPLYGASNFKSTSFYSIALGDTSKKKDVLIANIAHNKLAYLGNDFPVEILVQSDFFKGENIKVDLLHSGNVVATENRSILSDNEVFTIPFKTEAKYAGKQKYEVKISRLDEEFTYVNNSSTFFIEVLDNKQEILMVSAAPHPDIAAMRISIEKNINYKVTSIDAQDYEGGIEKYNLVILHQIPSAKKASTQLLKDLEEAKIPTLFCLGGQTLYSSFNKLKKGLVIVAPKGTTDAKPVLNKSFTSFQVEEGFKNLQGDLPPIQVPFAGNYKLANSSNILLNQKIGNTTTTYPLLSFNEVGGRKFGFLLGEGIWRWRLQDYIKNNSSLNFESLMAKTIQFLALKEDKNKFRLSVEGSFMENEHVIFQAELYNDIFELVNEGEVLLNITNESGEEYPTKSFSKIGDGYRIDAGVFSPGSYSYKASTAYNNEKYVLEGEFVVNEIKTEYVNAVADHGLLYNLSEQSGGRLYGKENLLDIADDLKQDNNIASLSYIHKEYTDVIRWKWILFLILAMFSIEWFLRKRNGAY